MTSVGADRRPPLLVVVSGSPASGKTTLARRLSKEDALGLPLLSRDAFAAALTDTLGIVAGDLRWTAEVLRPSGVAFFGAVRWLLAAGVGVIAEQAFYHGAEEHHVAALGEGARVAVIHCSAPPAEAQRRFIERAGARWADGQLPSGARVMVERMEAGTFDWSPYEPPALPDGRARTLTVDTSCGYAPDVDAIITFVRAYP